MTRITPDDRLDSPDGLVAAYFAECEERTSLRAQRLCESIEVCAQCGGPSTTLCRRQIRGLREMVQVCAWCRTPWEPAERDRKSVV